MAKKRMIDTKLWNDGWVKRLTVTERYLFLYFLSNDKCSFCGIYELPLSTISHETGLGVGEIEQSLLPKLAPKVFYHNEWVYLPNFKRHHVSNKSENSKKGYQSALEEVPSHIRDYFFSKPLEAPPSPSGTLASASALALALASAAKSEGLASNEAGEKMWIKKHTTGFKSTGEIISKMNLL